MAFLTRAELAGRLSAAAAITKSASIHSRTATAKHYLFLSHSHKDKALVDQFVAFLGSHADRIYIDWADKSVPEDCTAATAAHVKRKIRECQKLVLLATENACNSRWCPWELGIGDEANGRENVLVFPVTEPNRDWPGNEYIGIYRYADKDTTGVWQVVDPLTRNKIKLSDWIGSP